MSSLTESQVYEWISIEECIERKGLKHSSHCLLYTIDHNIYYALCQLRFDGMIGFPGGEVDVTDVTVGDIISATDRELYEEINYQFESVFKSEWICSHRKTNSVFVYHFFAKQLTVEQFTHLERTHMNAIHFPSESLGVFRIPIGEVGKQTSDISTKFLNNFLDQLFAGNARLQLLETVKKLSVLSIDDQKRIQLNNFEEKQSTNQIRAQCLIHSEFEVEYDEESVTAIYALMVMRNDGLFDWLGTTHTEERSEDLIIEAINQTLNKELSAKSVQIDCNNCIKMLFNSENELNYLFNILIPSSQFTQIESTFTEAENFLSNSYGIFRIPLVFSGQSPKASAYLNRFFRGYSKQRFAHECGQHFNTIYDKFKQKV